jgi:hypothetical protein
MTRYTLYVPVRLPDGTTVPNRWTVKFEADLSELMGGFIRLDATADRNLMFLYQADSDDPFAITLMEGFALNMKTYRITVTFDINSEDEETAADEVATIIDDDEGQAVPV